MITLSNLARRTLTFGGALVLAFGIVTTAPRPAAALLVNVNSSALNGTAARLDFQLLDGDLSANNSATISALNTNGTLQGFACTVGCAGGPPFVVNDALGLGQFIQDLVLGTALSFDLAFTHNFAGGDAGEEFVDRVVRRRSRGRRLARRRRRLAVPSAPRARALGSRARGPGK